MKKIYPIAFLILPGLLFSGCIFKEKKPAPQQKGGEVTLTVWRTEDSEEVFRPIIRSFQSTYKGVKIRYIKKDPEEYEIESLNALAAGKGPDIWSIRNDWMGRHFDKLIPAPEKAISVAAFQRNFVPVVSQDAIIDGKIYGLPLSIDTLALFYNPKFFREAEIEEPPATWDEFLNVVKKLTKKEKEKIIRAGVALGLAENVNRSVDILSTLMLQNGTVMVSPDHKQAQFNLPLTKVTGEKFYPGRSALEFYTSFANRQKEIYTWNAEMPNSLEAFMSERVAMIINYLSAAQYINQIKPEFSFRFAPLPQIKGASPPVDYASYYIETVTKNSQNPEIAWEFLKYIAEEGSRDYLEATKKPSPRAREIEKERAGRSDPWNFQAQTAQSWYKPDWLKVNQIFGEMIDDVTKRGISSQQAIDNAAIKITNLLRRE